MALTTEQSPRPVSPGTMTPRQRWLAVIAGKSVDRIPCDYWSTPEFTAKLVARVGCEGEALFRALGIDRPRPISATCKLSHHPSDPHADIWGIRRLTISYGTGEYSEFDRGPLADATTVDEIHAHRWPSADDYDYSSITEIVRNDDSYRILSAGYYEPFLKYCALRGIEQSFEDLVVNPEIADAILGHLFDFHYEHNRRVFEAGQGKIELSVVAEDLGGQHGPLMSLEMYRRFFRDKQRKMAELAHSSGAKVFYHTDGAARIFLPDLIDVVGIDVLNPLQWRCPGMELKQLVKDFGGRVAFHGGIDNQQTLPFGSVEDVRGEVRQVAEIMSHARWICAPCHNIQAVSPVENVLAMYDEIHRIGGK